MTPDLEGAKRSDINDNAVIAAAQQQLNIEVPEKLRQADAHFSRELRLRERHARARRLARSVAAVAIHRRLPPPLRVRIRDQGRSLTSAS